MLSSGILQRVKSQAIANNTKKRSIFLLFVMSLYLPRSHLVGASSVLSVGKGKFLRTSGELRNSYCEAVNISPSEKHVGGGQKRKKKLESDVN